MNKHVFSQGLQFSLLFATCILPFKPCSFANHHPKSLSTQVHQSCQDNRVLLGALVFPESSNLVNIGRSCARFVGRGVGVLGEGWFNRGKIGLIAAFLLHLLLGCPPLSRAGGFGSCRFASHGWGKVSTCLILSLLLSGLTVLMFLSSSVAAVSFPYPPMSLACRERALQCSA